MKHVVRWLVVIAAALAAPGAGLAGPIGDAPACVVDLLYDGQIARLGLARVVDPGRIHFQGDVRGCPGADPKCVLRAYVVKDDVVVTGSTRGAWTCVMFPNSSGGAEGWVRSSQIAAMSLTPPPAPSAWPGRWVRDSQAEVTLKSVGADVAVAGEGSWVGPNPGNVNVGEIAGRGRPKGDTLAVGDEFCNARLRLLGRYLIVADNNQCGGLNVSFTGVYRRG